MRCSIRVRRNHTPGVGEVKLKRMVTPDVECLQYSVEVKSPAKAGSNVATRNGLVRADGRLISPAEDLRLGLSKPIIREASTRGALKRQPDKNIYAPDFTAPSRC